MMKCSKHNENSHNQLETNARLNQIVNVYLLFFVFLKSHIFPPIFGQQFCHAVKTHNFVSPTQPEPGGIVLLLLDICSEVGRGGSVNSRPLRAVNIRFTSSVCVLAEYDSATGQVGNWPRSRASYF